MTSTTAADLRVAQLAECIVLAGPVHSILNAPVLVESREPHAVVVHLQHDRRSARAQLAPSLLIAGPSRTPVDADRSMGVAIAAPLARVSSAQLASSTELSDTALVRASRAFVTSLVADTRPHGITPSAALDDALVSLMRGIVDEHPHAAAPDSRDAALDVRVVAAIEARHTDPRLDVAQLARELHTSRRQLYRHAGDGGVATLLSQRRVATARELLRTRPDLTISEVASRAGFTTTSRLRAQFLRWTGQSPTECRRDAEREIHHA